MEKEEALSPRRLLGGEQSAVRERWWRQVGPGEAAGGLGGLPPPPSWEGQSR